MKETQPKTLVVCIEKLKPAHQDFLTFLVKNLMQRKDFHRGLLPFLTVSDAIWCLENLQLGSGKLKTQIHAILRSHVHYKLYPEEISRVMHLKDVKLAGYYRGKFSRAFCSPTNFEWGNNKTLVYLEQINKNKWKVTAHPQFMDRLTTWLAETMR